MPYRHERANLDAGRREITGWCSGGRCDRSKLYTTSLARCGIARDPLLSAA